MATSATRSSTVVFSGDVVGSEIATAATNANSPGQTEIKTLSSGNNTITPPSGGSTVVAVTITPPVGNTSLITLKGVNGDTGIPLHKTDPTILGLDSTLVTFVLNAAAAITGVRFQWN